MKRLPARLDLHFGRPPLLSTYCTLQVCNAASCFTLPHSLTVTIAPHDSVRHLQTCRPSLPRASACPPPSSRICNPPPVRQDLQSSRPSRLSPRGCNCASQTRKSLLSINSDRSVNHQPGDSSRSMVHSAGDDGKIAGPQNTCERDTSRNRTYTAVQGRFCNPPDAQVGIGWATCARRES